MVYVILFGPGADVIKIERPKLGDETRAWGYVCADVLSFLLCSHIKLLPYSALALEWKFSRFVFDVITQSGLSMNASLVLLSTSTHLLRNAKQTTLSSPVAFLRIII